ncbi:hypothetical protein [Cohnella sp.]|uniref:hypothetical protein n=1 Tax=Cohnella sp. TaxID=1883426 RepID=UPI0035692C54
MTENEQNEMSEQNEMDKNTEAEFANKQMDREFYGEDQELFASEGINNAAWINRNQS